MIAKRIFDQHYSKFKITRNVARELSRLTSGINTGHLARPPTGDPKDDKQVG